MYIQGSDIEIQFPTQWTMISRRMTAGACVIAQQYSSVTFVSLRCHCSTEICGALKKYYPNSVTFLKSVSLKLRKQETVFNESLIYLAHIFGHFLSVYLSPPIPDLSQRPLRL